ncbi:hypothetical protein KPH14_012663 [Odynerus spinipes]|uniref:RNA-directed DNA polymerase n=1 Tax=Odynerus spinipes TaxID=1348599 RepID=A0AAD9RFG8_9HYME|nr:hypothetical protein KPH14_012663 [Odynerus spinipes]
MDIERVKVEKLRDAGNWRQWQFVVSTLLDSDNLLEVCNGTLTKPIIGSSDYDAKLKEWNTANKAAKKIIVTTVEANPLQFLMSCGTAKEMWDKLHGIFDMKSDESLSLVQKQFFEYTWDSSGGIAKHISQLEQLTNQMKSLGGEIPASMLITRILSTLPPSYRHFHSAWDSTEATKRTLQNLTTRLLTEELRQQRKESETEETTVALISNLKVRTDTSMKTNSVKSKRRLSCFKCGSKEHLKRDCPKLREQNRNFDKTDRHAFVGSVDQGNSQDHWLIDSGASDHMTNRRDYFCKLREFSVPTKVRVGNGEELQAIGQGDIDIETCVNGKWAPGTMYDVLLVPDMKHNLFSVKVAARKGIDFEISDRGRRCIFQKNGKIIATGEEIGRLYKLNMRVVSSTTMCIASKLDTLQLWHERLGHQNKRHVKTFLNEIGINVTERRQKLDKKAYKGYLVGYLDDGLGYRVWIPELNDVIRNRDILFTEEKLSSTSTTIETGRASIEDTNDSQEGEATCTPKEHDTSSKTDENNERQLRDRTKIKQPDYFGCPISFLAEAVPMTSSSEKDADELLQKLKEKFKLTATADVKNFLGIEIIRLLDGSIFINQEKYIQKILERYKMEDSKPVSTPIEIGWEEKESQGEELCAPYREAVGNLMYLQVVSRPDIAFALNIASRSLDKPTESHWNLVKRILRYIKGTEDVGLLYKKQGQLEVLPVFNPAEDSGNVFPRWERWLRAFELLAVSKNITETKRKKAMLLHYGGLELQDIFFALPGAEEVDAQEDPFKETKDMLTNYFKPKTNVAYERHIFRQIRQNEGETMTQYVTRLRQQAKNCGFKDVEEEICGQIIKKCVSSEMRKCLLEKGTFLLDEALEISRTYETVQMQAKGLEGRTVAATRSETKRNRTGQTTMTSKEGKCFRCGYSGHSYKDERCPAKNKTCNSGAQCNVIDEESWKECKKKNIACESNRLVDKNVYPYGQSVALKLLGQFDCYVEAGNRKVCANFVVLKGRGRAIIGYRTATDLGILKIGCDINEMTLEEDNELGKLKNFKLMLPIDRTYPPIAQPMRRLPFKVHDKINEQIQKLLKLDIIEKVEGPTEWVSPVVPVIKKNSEVRLCIDMRRANEAIVRERYPLPVLDEVLDVVRGCEYFSTLDVKSAYHQIELHEDCRDITTFVTEAGLFRYKRLMFGINCAPEIFQRIMRSTLDGCEGVTNFIDDIIVCGRTKEEHDKRLKRVLEVLKEKGLTLNKEKCVLGKKEIVFLGFRISGKGYHPLESKVEAVNNFRKPKTAEEIRSFLGLVNFCAAFIPNLATISEPLRRLTRKNVPFAWNKEQENAFEKLKASLTNAETLGIFDINARTRVIANASPVGLGCVLTQMDKTGQWRVINYASRSLSECERRYSQTEKEALALVYACERFYIWLFGIEFELVTDHKALECIFTPRSKPNARIERWVLRLQSFKYKVVYETGKSNIADALSRLGAIKRGKGGNNDEYIAWLAKEVTPRAMTMEEIELESGKDRVLTEVRRAIETGNWNLLKDTRFFLFKDELCVFKNVLLKGTRIIIPGSLKRRVLELAHEGHPGIVTMKHRLRSKVWWDGIDRDAEKMVKSCRGCQLVRELAEPSPVKRNSLPEGPWESLAMDLMGPLPSGENILVITYYYSRYFEVVILTTITAKVIKKHLFEIFARHGFPKSVVCDNGRQFTDAELKTWLEASGVKISHTAPLWPQANGEVERQNRSILKRLRIAHAEGKDWKEELLEVLLMYRSTPHSVTGVSPAELLFKKKLKTKLPEMESSGFVEEEVREKDAWRKEKGRQYYNKVHHAKESCIKPGDEVLVRAQKKNKLSTNFGSEEFKVTGRVGNTVTLKSRDGKEYQRNVSHVQKIIGLDFEEEEEKENSNVDASERKSENGCEKERGMESGTDNQAGESKTERPRRNIKVPQRYGDYRVHSVVELV